MPGPLQVGHGTGFQAIYDQFKPGLLGAGGDQHVRFKGEQLYTHSSLSLHGRGAEAAAARAAKYESGAVQVRAALVRDFGADFADSVLTKVGSHVGRDLGQGVTRSDLARIKQEVDAGLKSAGGLVDVAIARPDSGLGVKLGAKVHEEFADENLRFTRAVADLRNAPQSEKAARAQAIYNTFVREGADEQVNISYELRGKIDAAFTGGGPVPDAVFDGAYREIRNLLMEGPAQKTLKQLNEG